jgi:hypothetical protein
MSAIRLKDLPAVLTRNFYAGVNTFIAGKPAIGKTHTINAFVAIMRERIAGFQSWDFYAPTMSPMDIQASAPDYESGKLVMYNNAALPNAYETPDVQGCIFLGELPNTDPATAKLLQKYINGEDMSGVLRKPDGIVVIADGNRLEDKSGVQSQGRAFMSRFEQLSAYVDADDNMAYASRMNWHPTVQLFFKDNPALIDNYDEVYETGASVRQRGDAARAHNGADGMSEEGKRGVWANMRAWERINKKERVADEMGSELTLAELAGNLGSGVAAQYMAHKKVIGGLISFDDIVANPAKAKMPKALDEVYQVAVIMALKTTEAQLSAVKTFAQRMPLEMQAVVLRTMAVRRGFNLAGSPEYKAWVQDKNLMDLLAGR